MSVQQQLQYRMEPGYAFPVEEVAVPAAEQRERHGFRDIPESVYGAYADPAFIAGLPVTLTSEAVLTCHPDRAPVHTVHRIAQNRRIRLEEPLRVAGAITPIEKHPRGWVAHGRWEYRGANDDLAVVVEPDILMVDKSSASRPRSGGNRGGGGGATDFAVVARKACTPETTKGYCAGAANLIHIDPKTAGEFGFRAPIFAGNQTVNFLMEAVARDGFPDRLRVEARFMWPIFWDEALAVHARKGASGRPECIRVRNAAGKTAADCRVIALGRPKTALVSVWRQREPFE